MLSISMYMYVEAYTEHMLYLGAYLRTLEGPRRLDRLGLGLEYDIVLYIYVELLESAAAPRY